MAFAPSSTRVLPACTGVLQAVRLGDTDTLEVVEAEDIGSTPVLKIALPSSPLPEHRSDRRPRLVCYPQRQPTERTQGAGFKSILRGAVGVLTSTRNL